MPRSPRLVITGYRNWRVGKHFAPPAGEIGIASWQGPQAMHMVGEDNPGIDAEGRTGAHPANRVAQYVDLRHQQIRTGVAQLHCKEEGSARNPIAAIIWHARNLPELAEGRNTLRLSALRLL